MKSILILATILISSCCYAVELPGRVTSVTDGDTVKIFDGIQEIKVRMSNIDAPESKQAFGSRSKQKLSEKIFGRNVILQYHEKDKYKRILGTIYLDGKNINLEMVKDGYAWAYRKYLKDHSFLEAEEFARKNKLGLWVDPFPTPPWEYRRKK